MGPDEFHMMVNHNCYTNVMGKKTFEFTLNVLADIQREAPEQYQQAIARTSIRPQEPEQWKMMAEKMRIPKDERTGVYEQHAGYFDLPHVDLQHFPAEQIPIYTHWAYIKIFRHNMVKQPDVLNLMYFFSQDYSLEEKRANYEFYEARTISRIVFVAVAACDPCSRVRETGRSLHLLFVRRVDGFGQLQPKYRSRSACDLCSRGLGQHGIWFWRHAHRRRCSYLPAHAAGPMESISLPSALPGCDDQVRVNREWVAFRGDQRPIGDSKGIWKRLCARC